MRQELLSVGIDLGTTTSQVIFSRITIESSVITAIPEVEIIEKSILYRSKIYFTPMKTVGVIDVEQLKKVIVDEYEAAGVLKEDIATGAIIITGETARKKNAAEVLAVLSDFAGDFVVATAGPDLESVLAGYGAGAAELSEQLPEKIANFDIGGGTTNAAVFQAGQVQDSFALDIGGRLICLDEQHRITYISKKINELIQKLGLPLSLGANANLNELIKLTDAFAAMLLNIALGKTLDGETKRLFIGHMHQGLHLRNIMFSGGVAEFIYNGHEIRDMKDVNLFGDIGPLLGWSIRKILKDRPITLLLAKEKIRATVIGAGSYSLHISGSTVIFDDSVVPLKNLPVLKIKNIELMREEIINKRYLFPEEMVAIAFAGERSPSYCKIKEMAAAIIAGLQEFDQPLIVVVEHDFAKALGQTLQLLAVDKSVICLDCIKTETGDYIDIGKSVASVVPVVVKTLLFKS
ncbi:ethanolamine utilization protein EutA [Sporomusaceae bacterium BoRhaA]|uniref:ethanolamine ammonia-lyase reactivating factor EutA n=1 Tax=Pelorhabdus rhamnosifermentans TaxID=2772457 RepID=UPI001C0605A3|nr:ethanolamine ammonia-lyase reactivating factor EutA [Pelorhabdus rhamnosifermentans]MBU2701272.1 ethanolamine utilization protein EutA [Pelorhabdus rhamnosifermentans]